MATTVTALALLVNTAGIGLRWVESHQMGIGYAPLSNMYESLVFFFWSIAVFYLGLQYKYKNRYLGAFAMPFAAVAMLLAEMKNPEIRPLVPALQSNWLIAHVFTCFIGYAAFAVACGLGMVYLLGNRIFVADSRYHHRCHMGKLCMGNLLELGPQGDLVADHLVCVCHSLTCQIHHRMGRKQNCLVCHRRFCLGDVHLLRGELPPTGSPQLRIKRVKWPRGIF